MVVIFLILVWDLLKKQEKKLILKLPPHASHVLQPTNLRVYRPLELKWDEEIIKWQRRKYSLAQKFHNLLFFLTVHHKLTLY